MKKLIANGDLTEWAQDLAIVIGTIIAVGTGVYLASLLYFYEPTYQPAPVTQTQTNLDPQKGPVAIPGESRIEKQCDGTTLLYIKYNTRDDAITAIPNSKECTK